jgi:Trypsin-co-occurring domain 2
MPTLASTMVELIQQIKKALAYWQAWDDRIQIESASLELKGEFKELRGGEGGPKLFELIPIKLSSSGETSTVQTITLKLTPRPLEAMKSASIDLGDELIRALQAIGSAVSEAALGEPPCDLEEGTVTLSFGITEEGGITVIGFGRSGSNSRIQTVTLKLVGAVQQPDTSARHE